MVYKLYDLTEDEIRIVENNWNLCYHKKKDGGNNG